MTPAAEPVRESVERSDLLGAVISSEVSPSFFELEFRLNVGADAAPGRFVAIGGERTDGRPCFVLARIDDVHEVNPHEDAQSSTIRNVLPFGTEYAPEGQSTVIFRVAKAEPLEEALVDADGKVEAVSAVETLPKAGAPVFAASPELILPALGLEPEPALGIHVGAVHGAPEIPVVLPKSVIQRHI